MITKYILIEQIVRRLNGGNASSPATAWDEEIALAIGQAINARLKADYITNTLAMGETIPEGVTMVTYTGANALPVTQYGNFSICKLPCMPVKLMRDMGVYHVSRDGDEGNPFIPVQSGLYAYYSRQKMINELLGQVGYTPGYDSTNGPYILFYTDLTAQSVSNVMVKLIVADVFSLGDHDPLPITAEMQSDIIDEVEKRLSRKVQQDKINDTTTVQ